MKDYSSKSYISAKPMTKKEAILEWLMYGLTTSVLFVFAFEFIYWWAFK